RADDGGAQFNGRHVSQRALKTADGGTRCCDNDDVLHDLFSKKNVATAMVSHVKSSTGSTPRAACSAAPEISETYPLGSASVCFGIARSTPGSRWLPAMPGR